ncbi:MAG: helix-turn-helix domain-containing protein [Lachnospiraceae bacterium]|nr:helix-turn-helix domain-containing protein [Lachnospiraceae bacterium]
MTKSQIINITKIVEEMKNIEITKEDQQIYNIVYQIAKERKNKNITQKQLEKMTNIPQTTISRIETFIEIPTLPTLMKILNALNLNISITQEN